MKHILLTAFAASLLVAGQAAFAYPQADAGVSQRDVELGEVSRAPTSGTAMIVKTEDLYENRGANQVAQDEVNRYVFRSTENIATRPNSFGGRR